MTKRAQNASLVTLCAVFSCALGVLGYYGARQAFARSEGEASARVDMQIIEHDRRIEALERLTGERLSDVIQRLSRIEGKLEGK